MRSFLCVIWGTFVFFSFAGAALGQSESCSLDDFDSSPPPHVQGFTPPTAYSSLEWASDADPKQVGDGFRAWHYVRNLHERNLSVYWAKPDLLVRFDRPLPQGGVFCKFGFSKRFEIDDQASITVAGDGTKAAQVYVPVGPSPLAGAEIRTDYIDGDGNTAFGFVRLLLRYFISDKVMEVTLEAGPDGTGVGFDPKAIGIEEGNLYAQLTEIGAEWKEATPFGSLFKVDKMTAQFLGEASQVSVVVARFKGSRTLVFTDVPPPPPTAAPILLLIDAEGVLIAATKIQLNYSSEN